MTLHRRSLQLPDGRISYLERGAPAAGSPTFIFLHGLMGTAATFAACLDALPAGRHAIAIDLPGAGGSDRSRTLNPALHRLSRVLGDVLNVLALPAPVLVGHSHGGAVAMHLAASEPERVRGLVLMAPAHPYFRHADGIIAFYLSPLGRAFAHTMPWYPAWMQMIGLRRMAGPQSWDTRERLAPYRENLRTRGTIASLLRLLRTWHSDMGELDRLLQSPLCLPTLLIWGDHDRAVPVSTAFDLKRQLSRAELEVLPGVGHRPAEERPELCAALVERWWEQRMLMLGSPINAARESFH